MPPFLRPFLVSAEPWWWLGPAITTFCWGVVPVMRLRHNVMARADYSDAARFWWFSAWVPIGLSGLGLSVLAAPFLASPWVTGVPLRVTWPPVWFGWRFDLTDAQCIWAFGLGLAMTLGGLKWALFAWFRQRQASLFIWRANLRRRTDARTAGRDED